MGDLFDFVRGQLSAQRYLYGNIEIINRSTKLERNITYTREQTSIAVKSILAVLVNSIAVPLVVNKIITDNLYGVDGLADVVFF